MRTLLVSALALVASPIWGQSHLADGAGVFAGLEVPDVTTLGYGSSLASHALRGEVGYRVGNGLDIGMHARAHDYNYTVIWSQRSREARSTSSFEIGPTVGFTGPVGERTFSRIAARGAYLLHQSEASPSYLPDANVVEGYQIASSALSLTAHAGMGRTLPVLGSISVQPTLSVYTHIDHTLDWELTGAPNRLTPIDRTGETMWRAGVQAELPIQFNAFGQDMALTSSVQIPFLYPGGFYLSNPYMPVSLGARANF